MRVIGATVMMGTLAKWREFVPHLREHVNGWIAWNPGVPEPMVRESKRLGATILEDFRLFDERPFSDEEGMIVHSLFTAAREDLNADAVLMLYPTEEIIDADLDLGDHDVIAARFWRRRGTADGPRYEPEYTRKVLLVRACPHFMWATMHGNFPFGATKIKYAGDVATDAYQAGKWGESVYGKELIDVPDFDKKGIPLWQK